MFKSAVVLGLCLAVIGISGCGDDRKPIPVLTIRVMADGNYQLNTRPMTMTQLRDELQLVASQNRRSMGTAVRVQVRIATQTGASQARKEEVINSCLAVGMNSIDQSASDEE